MLELIIQLLESFIDFVVYGKTEGECTVVHMTADNVLARKLILAIARMNAPCEWSITYDGNRGVCRKDSDGNFVTWKYNFDATKRWTLCLMDASGKLTVIYEIIIK